MEHQRSCVRVKCVVETERERERGGGRERERRKSEEATYSKLSPSIHDEASTIRSCYSHPSNLVHLIDHEDREIWSKSTHFLISLFRVDDCWSITFHIYIYTSTKFVNRVLQNFFSTFDSQTRKIWKVISSSAELDRLDPMHSRRVIDRLCRERVIPFRCQIFPLEFFIAWRSTRRNWRARCSLTVSLTSPQWR